MLVGKTCRRLAVSGPLYHADRHPHSNRAYREDPQTVEHIQIVITFDEICLAHCYIATRETGNGKVTGTRAHAMKKPLGGESVFLWNVKTAEEIAIYNDIVSDLKCLFASPPPPGLPAVAIHFTTRRLPEGLCRWSLTPCILRAPKKFDGPPRFRQRPSSSRNVSSRDSKDIGKLDITGKLHTSAASMVFAVSTDSLTAI
ncbi:uncharacterized protein ARMOST_02304 [Armillaria ostoyae]|uniref:Uncharacterized protein n=1 Tax=Armillaria ostoyae TaxID=47428 RepID=A0A284QRI3_ARMOS|nr:uncharacterized protein ARMOST_02304 [Armillaria ostoyae]